MLWKSQTSPRLISLGNRRRRLVTNLKTTRSPEGIEMLMGRAYGSYGSEISRNCGPGFCLYSDIDNQSL